MLDVDPLADIIGSKLRTGRVPQIVRALGFSAQGMQDGLRSIDLLGDPRFRCDPATDDFYLVLIRAREQLKRERDQARRLGNVQRARQLDADQKAIKLVASSATHGIFLETNLVPVSKPEDVRVYSGGLRGNLEAVDNLEIPGTYFHPLLSTLITSAGRLMLAIAEELVYREQLDWAFCDTDSMALVQTDLMSPAEFIKAGMRIQSWFEPLNPTPELRTFFEFKDENFTLDGTRKLKPLLGTAISSKQHVLFNMDENNQPIIRKATRHGLGHLVSPYSDDEAPLNTPTPIADLRIPRWIHDVWLFIITAMLDGTPHRVLYNKLPGFDRPAVRMTVISTPEILEWFELAEVDNTCAASPFGRILAFIAARDQYGRELSPVAPYQADLERAAQECTDRRTGEHITVKQLKTYADVLGPFQMRSEPKLLNARHRDAGSTTARRRIIVAQVDRIGKDSHEYEEQGKLGYDPSAQQEYTSAPDDTALLVELVKRACNTFGVRQVARAADVDTSKVSRMLRGLSPVTASLLRQLLRGIDQLRNEACQQEARRHLVVAQMCDLLLDPDLDIAELARMMGIARPTLSAVIAGARPPSDSVLNIMEATVMEFSPYRVHMRS